ncbi:hypothetical protein JXA88_13075 [Candidatus Fermentibacteria bacterium]|nr:hypothetical protein [Candidatus Fermentibacteria bacterium]
MTRILAVTLAALLFSALTAEALETNPATNGAFAIKGIVRAGEVKPIEGATVEFMLTTMNGKSFYVTTMTDSQGRYKIDKLPVSYGRGRATAVGIGVTTVEVVIERNMTEIHFNL